ncbi:DEBR0S7_02124g1_1 [Brettanomyces bruxellensis]|uniref:DEBR0S7_02124g1_1 n=1 Tax=Dekkera bruxellensis TaxID=5007 RepID=A0A7D9D0M7_DEKBR|nr:DEBR0S7_02124g1_1 [Brettanomyces bruxellensis]
MEGNVGSEEKEQDCSVCHVNKSKYMCPSCGTRTCSLNCFKRHKLQMNCTGKSDVTLNKTRYAPKGQITNLSVQRDYNFLMKMDRNLKVSEEDLADNIIVKTHKRNNRRQFDWRRNKRRVTERYDFTDDRNRTVRNGIVIKRQPIGMSRQRLNRSYFDQQMNKFFWTIEWILIDNTMKPLDRIVTFKNNDSANLGETLPYKWLEKKILHNDVSTQEDKHDDSNDNEEDSKKTRPKCLNGDIHCFVNPFDRRGTLIEISTDKSIGESLAGMQFIEFPTVYICESDDIKKDGLEFKTLNQVEVNAAPEQALEQHSNLNSGFSSDLLGNYTSGSDSSDSEPPEESSTRTNTGVSIGAAHSAQKPGIEVANLGSGDVDEKPDDKHNNQTSTKDQFSDSEDGKAKNKGDADPEDSSSHKISNKEREEEKEEEEDTNYCPPETI